MENKLIQDIFKISIYKRKLALNIKEIENYCYQLKDKNKGRVRTNVGGWQSNDLLKDNKILNHLISSIVDNSNEFAKHLDFKKKLSMDNIWININSYKDFNKTHCHSDCLISGVYYVKTPKNCGNITFVNNNSDNIYNCWGIHQFNNYNNYNSPEWFIPSLENHLYLFPNWLNHYVQPNMNEKEDRISISFNLL